MTSAKQLLCNLNEVTDGQSKGFDLEGKIFVVRQGQTVYAYHNHCPHLGIQLEWQPDKFLDFDAELIQCSTRRPIYH